jgi:hypothetical protein
MDDRDPECVLESESGELSLDFGAVGAVRHGDVWRLDETACAERRLMLHNRGHLKALRAEVVSHPSWVECCFDVGGPSAVVHPRGTVTLTACLDSEGLDYDVELHSGIVLLHTDAPSQAELRVPVTVRLLARAETGDSEAGEPSPQPAEVVPGPVPMPQVRVAQSASVPSPSAGHVHRHQRPSSIAGSDLASMAHRCTASPVFHQFACFVLLVAALLLVGNVRGWVTQWRGHTERWVWVKANPARCPALTDGAVVRKGRVGCSVPCRVPADDGPCTEIVVVSKRDGEWQVALDNETGEVTGEPVLLRPSSPRKPNAPGRNNHG